MQTRKRKNDRNHNNTTCKKYKTKRINKMNAGGDCDRYSRYYSMDDICEYLQHGGGIVPRAGLQRRRVHTQQMINEFIRAGWRPEFIHATFRRMYDNLLAEYPRYKFIEEYAKAAIRRLDVETQASIKDALLQIGLRADISIQLESIVRLLQDTSYTDVQVLDTAIYYLLGHYKPLTSSNTKHILQDEIVNSWFNYTYESKTLSIYNFTKSCSNTNISDFSTLLASLPVSLYPAGEYIYHFHTTSWKSSLSIIEQVDRLQGRKCLDFGIYPGFYMSHSIHDCLEWGHLKSQVWSNEVAILIFAIPKSIPSTLKFKELVDDEWKQVTQHSRKCQDSTDLKMIRTLDLLYGNMVRNPTPVKNGATPVTHTPPKKQLVSKSDAGDKFVHSCLIGAVYFQKNSS